MRNAALQESANPDATVRNHIESEGQKKPYEAIKASARPGRGRPGTDRFHLVLLGLGAAFLAYLGWKIGLREIWREFVSLGWGLIPLVLAEGIAEMIHTLGWRHCMNEPYRSLPWYFLFRVRMAGYAINYLTPTATLGGEVTKGALLASAHKGPGAVTGVMIGKLCFGLSHLLFVVGGSILILWTVKLPPALWIAMLSSSALVVSGMVIFLVIQKRGKLGAIVRWLAERKVGGRLLLRAAASMTEIDEALKVYYRERRGELTRAICWHLVGYSIGIAQTWYFFSLLNRTSWVVAAATWFLGMWFDLLTFAMPLGLGTLEGSRIIALRAVGYNALLGMTYGMALRLAQLFWSAIGLVNYALLVSHKNANAAMDSQGHPRQSPRDPGV
jgi:uncharacterized membrane protein YbhN (UPF0104 family)